jgi:hypothetical protein
MPINPAKQLWQLGMFAAIPPRLIFAKQLGRRAPSRLTLIINVAQRLTIGVAHDEAVGRDFGSPRRREAARRATYLGFIELATLRQ